MPRPWSPSSAALGEADVQRAKILYYARVNANPFALTVKAADLADNSDPARLALLDPEERAHFEDRYVHARHVLGIY